MSTIAMSGSDTATINGRTLTDLADGDCVVLDFPNEIASVKTGKNGNSIYGLNETGRQCKATYRLIRGSADDKFMLNLLANQRNNFAGFILMNGTFVKKVGDGAGNIASDTYINSGGVFTKNIIAKSNVEGDSEQSVAIYEVMFSNAPRIIA